VVILGKRTLKKAMTMPPSKKSEVEKRVFLRPNIKESFEELNQNEVVHLVDLAIREMVEELSGCLFQCCAGKSVIGI